MDRRMDKEHAVHIYGGICNLKEGNKVASISPNKPSPSHRLTFMSVCARQLKSSYILIVLNTSVYLFGCVRS